MKWKNAVRDHLPESSATVLVSLGGVYFVAFYDDVKKSFRISGEESVKEFDALNDHIYWIEITDSN